MMYILKYIKISKKVLGDNFKNIYQITFNIDAHLLFPFLVLFCSNNENTKTKTFTYKNIIYIYNRTCTKFYTDPRTSKLSILCTYPFLFPR